MSEVTAAQAAEIDKYGGAYQDPRYAMSEPRFSVCARALREQPYRGWYLDVSCGRGEMLAYADEIGFEFAAGTEVVGALLGQRVSLAVAWDLPFVNNLFDVVSMFDVIEHLLPGDDQRACYELARVARRVVLITANNLPSIHHGVDLHVNRRPYEEWDERFREWFPGARVEWLRGYKAKNSEMWRIALDGADDAD